MVGALGSGKTATLCVEAIMLSIENPGNVGLIARRTLPELKSTTMKRFFEFLPDPFVLKWNKTERELYIRTNGKPSLVHFGPLDEIGRYKSLELGFYAIDEADQTTEEHWLTLAGRLRMKDIPCYGLLATNPTSTNHWIYNRWVSDPTRGYALFRSKTKDNEENLPEGYIEELKSTYPENWAKRYIEGLFGVIQSGDPCFPDFKDTTHVKSINPLPDVPMIRGWDFGRRRPCVVFCQVDDLGSVRIYDTYLGQNEDLYLFSDKVIRFSNRKYNTFQFEDYCDIAGKQERDSGQSSITILNNQRIYPKFRYSSPDARATFIRKMMRERTQSGEEKFLIDPRNEYLIEALLGGYYVDDDGKPKKDGYFEHGIDALGYVISNTCMVGSHVAESRIEIPEPKWSYRGAY
jgi:hypothetical protein